MKNFVAKHYPLSWLQTSWTLAFVTALAFTLCEGTYLWLARIGWLLLAVLFTLHRRYALYSVFFFSGFFHPAGFFRELGMTLKHFHIACLFLIMVDMLEARFFSQLKKGLALLGYLLPVIAILFLAV